LNPIDISADTALVFDVQNEHIIFEKNMNEKHAIASLTKVATFLTAIQNAPLDTVMTVSESAASQEPDSMGLFPGEKLTLKQLLQGLILVSGNDSAETIAENALGLNSRRDFIEKMNAVAYYLGMDATHFVNPHGLDVDSGSNQSSSYDLMLLMKEAMKSPVFMEISSAREITVPELFSTNENHKNFTLINTSPTIDYPGYISGKPGFTYDAGKCQITVSRQNGKTYMAIILGSEDRKVDTEKMLNWAFSL
jgi:serine-type D-Ala-D-Ala carboxypeptidase (penicillin-binding protein 5/6)